MNGLSVVLPFRAQDGGEIDEKQELNTPSLAQS